jgi:two-component system sensor histidine kinase BaeS
MNRLFVRTLLAFLAALGLLAGLQTAAWFVGFHRSLSVWDRARSEALAETALRVLRSDATLDTEAIPAEPPLAVYDAAGRLVFSNRAFRGGRGAGGELRPLRVGESLVGYDRGGRMQFQADAANERFAESLQTSAWIGAGGALVIAILAGLLFSRGLTRPAVAVAEGLERIARGELHGRLPEGGTEEIAQIARSANRLGEQLEREREIRRQWVQDIAHDLRTPISALKAQFEAMRDGVLETSRQRVGKNLREIERVETLVLDLEELMRLESPEMRPKLAPVAVAPLLDELRERFALELERKSIAWQQRSSLDSLSADSRLLERALTNFVANAVRHTPEGGTIRVTAAASTAGPEFRVGNTGIPIPAEERLRVFERLYRGEFARNSPGSGLGLTIALRIAELHGGTVRIGDWEDGGVEVTLTIAGGTSAGP